MSRRPRKAAWAGGATLALGLLFAWLNGGIEAVVGEFAGAAVSTERLRAPAGAPPAAEAAPSDGRALERLYRARISGEVVEGAGRVRATLRDDDEGSRHQRFILELPGGQTVLVSHNIDLAPRVVGLAKGDTVEFRGQYEWSEQGGVVHWTHRDPAGRRPGGWLRHAGATYR